MNGKYTRYYLPLTVLTAACLLFLRINTAHLMEWDESRNGVNAYEMLHNGDWVNYYYDGKIDNWNAKPPLLIWSIALCYKFFGFGTFALRLPAAIATLFFFFYFYRLVKLFEGANIAFYTCLVLLSSKAIIGPHVGLSGDFDALLLLFLTMTAYYLLLFLEFDRKGALNIAALCLGLAFYSKGIAAFIYAPGFLLYIAISNKRDLFSLKRMVPALLIFIAIAGSWVVLQLLYGKSGTPGSEYGTKTALEVMFYEDVYRRFTATDFGNSLPVDYGFMLSVTDARMNIWNYLLYPAIIAGGFRLYNNRKRAAVYLSHPQNRLVLLSVSLLVPVYILFTFTTNKMAWYMAPFFGFIAVVIVKFIISTAAYHRRFALLWIGLFAFTFVRHVYYIATIPHESGALSKVKSSAQSQELSLYLPQDEYLYRLWESNSNHDSGMSANVKIKGSDVNPGPPLSSVSK